jgi:hypothetical protein
MEHLNLWCAEYLVNLKDRNSYLHGGLEPQIGRKTLSETHLDREESGNNLEGTNGGVRGRTQMGTYHVGFYMEHIKRTWNQASLHTIRTETNIVSPNQWIRNTNKSAWVTSQTNISSESDPGRRTNMCPSRGPSGRLYNIRDDKSNRSASSQGPGPLTNRT